MHLEVDEADEAVDEADEAVDVAGEDVVEVSVKPLDAARHQHCEKQHWIICQTSLASTS
jgi:hypothetical protein